MIRLKMTRRRLFGVAAATSVTGLVLARGARLLDDTEARVAGASRSEDSAASAGSAGTTDQTRPIAAWLDSLLSGDDLTRARATLAPWQPRALELDVIWQWRREIVQELTSGVGAVAITRWDKAILLSGLAREASLPVRQRRIAHSLFQTEIG